MSEKKSFQIYFDNMAGVEQLSREQRGDLLLALMRCAVQAAEDPAFTVQGFLERKDPSMDPLTGMVFLFMANTICRDTQKWRQQVERDQRRKEERSSARKRKAGKGTKEPPGGEESSTGGGLIRALPIPADMVQPGEEKLSWEEYRQQELRKMSQVNPRVFQDSWGR